MRERYRITFYRTLNQHAVVVVNADTKADAERQAEIILASDNDLNWIDGDSDTDYDVSHVPYPMCRHPVTCAGAGYCQHDPACND